MKDLIESELNETATNRRHTEDARNTLQDELARAVEALRLTEEKYQQILNTTSEGFFLLDQDQRIIDINRSALKVSRLRQG